MKTLLLIAALTAGTAAFAQDTPVQPVPPADSMSTMKPGAPTDADTPTNPGAPMSPAAPMAPDAAPAPMAPPMAGAPMAGGMANHGMAATPSDKNYPTCTRTMTDNCTNRGGR